MRPLMYLTLPLLLVTQLATSAAPKCSNLFFELEPTQNITLTPVTLKYQSTPEEVAALYAQYPKIKTLVNKTIYNVRRGFSTASGVKKINKLGDMKGVRYTSQTNDWATGKIDTLSAELQQQIIDVHNVLRDKTAMVKYIEKLVQDAAVLMMKEKDKEVYGRLDMNDPLSDKSTEKVRKEVFLEAGHIDHVSLMRVLVNRIRARGDNISVIPNSEKGGYENNQSKTMKFATFFEVPKHGPFFDLWFGKGGHGQEVHLVQMDFVESVLTNRKEFWDYATNLGKGEWVWDTLFDGFSTSYQQPENLGPALNQTIPVY